MLSLSRGFWNKHRRKLFIALGALGGGYAIYKFYDAHRRRVTLLERQLEGVRDVDELIKSQLQNHFENIQRISDTTTLPYAMHYLKSRIAADLDVSYLTEKLRQAKGQYSTLTTKDKAELWERLKILSFTRLATSIWSMTVLCLYVKVLVNILGRHLYVDIARGSESSETLDEVESFGRHGHQEFLATADYLSTYGISTLIMNMQSAAAEVLKDKQLKDPFSMEKLHEMIMQILQLFMSIESPNYWISYLVPENAVTYRQMMALPFSGFDDTSALMDVGKLEQLVSETWAVLSSTEFRNITELSLNKLVNVLVEEIDMQLKGGSSSASEAIPLVTLLPRVTQLAPQLLDEPSSNKFIQIIQSLPEVQFFYTLVYSNTPPLS
ncbi:peroxisome biogenesis protein 3-1 isoform X1 [Dendrobium catenatum]|uniref:Peroxisome biogenesis protein 3-2 n=1 Tax=Dendrobium catenatum TaxID=906689 RepID=A0A2I0X425_9ASPA|nr:peroxisome biogenesis protein 3-1 isoform X1 [Dendrobium catenatum]PKU82674.1 Peroxisome biogenesis protein 3-2 [Dendrobium catenatum]